MPAAGRGGGSGLRSLVAAVMLGGCTGLAASAAWPDSTPTAAPVRGTLIARPDSPGRKRIATPTPAPAASDTILLDFEPEEPRAAYGSFGAARESLAVVLRRALGACADSARWSRGPTRFLYRDRLTLLRTSDGRPMWAIEPRDTEVSVPSLSVRLNSISGDCPDHQTIANALAAAGWSDDAYYGADGPDGTAFASCCREAICHVRAQWDGGDDSDSTYVPAPGFTLEVVCVPRPREDPAYRRARRR